MLKHTPIHLKKEPENVLSGKKKKDIIIIKIRKKALVGGPEQWIPANPSLEATYFAYPSSIYFLYIGKLPRKFIPYTFKDLRT